MAQNNQNGRNLQVTPNTSHVPGHADIALASHWFPNNAALRENKMNGVNLQNTMGTYPRDFQNETLQQMYENIRILKDTFEENIAARHEDDYRFIFKRETIPLHANTLSVAFMKHTGIDERPDTAALTGLETWDPKWNEVSIQGSAMEVSTAAYGRFYKKNRWMDDISSIRWFETLAAEFANNAARTLNNLAGVRMFEGSNKLFVKSLAPYNPNNPYAARLELSADASEVAANLSWEALKEAKWLMQNWDEEYTVVGAAGALETKKRKAVIPGYSGGNYLVLLSANGYEQLLADPDLRENFVINGGYLAQQVANGTLGITAPFLNFILKIVENPITIDKSATPKVDVDGKGELECAFVIGGGGKRIAVEVALEGYTRMITVGYEEDKKVDPFSLLAYQGWMAVVDFQVLAPEAIICIPYIKMSYIKTGSEANAPAPNGSTAPQWNHGQGNEPK